MLSLHDKSDFKALLNKDASYEGSGQRKIVLSHYFSALATISARSNTRTLSSASLSFRPSSNMVMQYGQQTQIVAGFCCRASSTRATLMRLPVLSSIHMRPPPAPQQKDLSWWRPISIRCCP